MGVIDGKNAAVGSESTVWGWKITHSGNLVPIVASNTSGGALRDAGNKDWVGYYDLFNHTPANFPGDSVAGTFSLDGTHGYAGTARIAKIEWEWDLEQGGYIQSRVSFGANGTLTSGPAAASDDTVPAIYPVQGLMVKLHGVQQGHCHYMRLIIERNCRRYCDAEADGQFLRTEGDRIDAIAMWGVYEDNPAAHPVVGNLAVVAMYVDDTTYWELTWMRIEQVEQVLDRENKRPVGAVVTASFTAHNGTSVGTIKNPAGATKWP